jgi:uncharacterized repeat protein (TIGR01451 family)
VLLDDLQFFAAGAGGCVGGVFAPLTTAKTADSPTAYLNATAGYTITVSNPNAAAATLTSITDDLPAGFTYQAGSTTGVTTTNPTVSGQHLTWSGGWTVPGNGSVSLHFLAGTPGTPGEYRNSAGGTSPTASVTGVTDTAPVTVLEALTTGKTADAANATGGTTDGYTITIGNPNAVAVPLSEIHDDLPVGFAYQAASTTGVTTANPTVSGRHLSWSGSWTVPANGNVTLHFLVGVPNTPGTFTNDAGGTSPASVTGVTAVAPITVKVLTSITTEPAIVDADTLTPYLFSLNATLKDAVGLAVANKTITFTAGGVTICTATTNLAGRATCSGPTTTDVNVLLALGYVASFAGDASYFASTANGHLVRAHGLDV